jgi:hypothetical protein
MRFVISILAALSLLASAVAQQPGAAGAPLSSAAAAQPQAAAQREREQIELQAQQEARRRADERRRQEEERLAAEQRRKTIEEATSVVPVMVGVAFGLLLYFVPSMVGRHKVNALAIFVFNLFLGWTFWGWVLPLVWACTKDSVIETHEHAGDFKVFYSHRGALPAKTNFHDSAFTGRFARDASRIRRNNSIHISLGCYHAMKIYDDELLEVLRALRQTYSDSRQRN